MEGVSVLNELIYKMQLPAQLAGAAAVDIMLYFAYGKQHSSPKADEIPPERTPQAEKWARIAVAFDPERAEAIMVLGDVYLQRKEFSAAETMYRAALARGMLKQTEDRCLKAHLHPYYNELPNQRLSELCLRRGEFVPALLHCTLAADANPGDAELLNRRGEILQQIFLDQKERIDVFCTD
jgi:Flp pilus assembly protein TadD